MATPHSQMQPMQQVRYGLRAILTLDQGKQYGTYIIITCIHLHRVIKYYLIQSKVCKREKHTTCNLVLTLFTGRPLSVRYVHAITCMHKKCLSGEIVWYRCQQIPLFGQCGPTNPLYEPTKNFPCSASCMGQQITLFGQGGPTSPCLKPGKSPFGQWGSTNHLVWRVWANKSSFGQWGQQILVLGSVGQQIPFVEYSCKVHQGVESSWVHQYPFLCEFRAVHPNVHLSLVDRFSKSFHICSYFGACSLFVSVHTISCPLQLIALHLIH